MLVDEEVYLEHYGVKGMQWGVRKTRSPAEQQARIVRNEKIKHRLRQATVVGVGVGMAVLASRQTQQVSRIRQLNANSSFSSFSPSSAAVDRIISDFGNMRMPRPGPPPARPMPAGAGPMPSAQPRGAYTSRATAQLFDRIRAEHNESIRLANAQLRATDNRIDAPLWQREYLTEWD